MSLLAAGGPWWAVLVLSLPGAVAVIVRSVFPQESADRLAWWRERRLHRERLAGSRSTRAAPSAAPGEEQPRLGP
ncbi:hypothetical protein [Actinacidiphila guanduensis]|uniref:Uncharacterized protein n=1 Tax=Actinacidiphila guanduensis TaxID=310781 RepID=A0A1G9UW04_9ACTN|nr:hypothetical protein [Actinacidiphila guanduensis]SDM64029.1 hypothetical protein SAMN05216259_10116 [Actinacidiphila guanduensis]